MLREAPVGKIRLRDVAARAGVSHQTIYNLVGNTDRLLSSVIDEYVERTNAALGDDLPRHAASNPVDAVVSLAKAMARVTLEDPIPLKSVLRELGPLNVSENKTAGLEAPLEYLLLEGGVPSSDAENAARLIVYGFRGLLVSWAHDLVPSEIFLTEASLIAETIAGAAVARHLLNT